MREPRATYRLQIGPGPGFAQPLALVPYLHQLGVSHLALRAPCVSDGLGAEADLRLLAAAAHARDMGLILDLPCALAQDPAQYVAAHADAVALVAEGVADGLRVGHPDGTQAPVAHLRALREAGVARVWAGIDDAGPSGDVRARLQALEDLNAEWAVAVGRWRAENAGLRTGDAPSVSEERLVYRTLAAAWPIDTGDLELILISALREAGPGSRGTVVGEGSEQAIVAFARAVLGHGAFRYGFDGWAARVADVGARLALGQTLLKLTLPGVPEIDQGDETWLVSLAEGQRGDVDWEERARALTALRRGDEPGPQAAKLHLVWRALALRRDLPGAFRGPCTPIEAGDGVRAFLRGDDVLVAVAVHDAVTGSDGWALPPAATGLWCDVLDDAEHELPDRAGLASVLGPDGRALLRRTG